jgi:3-hydroxyisobutyrate dehydrogenase-like beta-hydroxyacid dehydrogenase
MAALAVGFVGLGKMGRPLSLHLISAGFSLRVYDRSAVAVDALVAHGAAAAASPAEVAAASDVVCLSLPTPAAVEQVVWGTGGLVEGVRPGGVVLDFSTNGPATCRAVAARLGDLGAAYLDAPVSGGTAGAEAGTLSIMVGGARAHYERVLPLLQAVGQKIWYAGPLGSGAVVKLVNNLLVGINLTGAAEAMVLGVKAGVDPQLLCDAIAASTGSSFQLQRSVPGLILKREFGARFALDLLHKDLALVLDLAREAGVRTLLGAVALQVVEEARGAGYGEQDMAAVIRPLERLAGVEVRA